MTGDDMHALRETLGMTRLQMAQYLGVSEQMIWLYESGRRPLTRKRRAQLATLAQREQVVLEGKAPCPACQGTGWVPGPAPAMRRLMEEPDPETEPEPVLELARPDPAPAARGPGRPRHIR